MKNRLLFGLVFLCFISCKKIDQEVEPDLVKKQTLLDTVENSDKDSDGCLVSAGYVWSQLNKECVKIFESAVTLYPYSDQDNEDETKNAYIVFSKDDGNEAEIFLPSMEKSHLFVRTQEGQPWKFEDWQLVPWKGFVLKKGEEILFAGDGGIGPKVTGSDKIED